MKSTALIGLFILVITSFAQAQTSPDPSQAPDTVNTAKIYVIRSTGHVGSAVNLRIWVDSVMYCKVKNNSYAVIYVPPGTHNFYANSWDAGKPKEKLALKMEVEAGKTYYLSMRMKPRFFENEIFVEEVTYNTAAPSLQKYERDTKCD